MSLAVRRASAFTRNCQTQNQVGCNSDLCRSLGAAAGAVEAGIVQEADETLCQISMDLIHARVADRHLQTHQLIIIDKRSTKQTKTI
jgi:hypothetical protein